MASTVTDEPETPPAVVINGKRKERTDLSRDLEAEIEAEIERQLKLNPELPTLNTVAEAYENVTVKMFSDIAASTGGETYMIDNARFIVEAVTSIIENYMTAETDLVFLIDKTGSMTDDIQEIRKSINTIIEAIEPFEHARVGFAFYGDKNVDGFNWFHMMPLTQDLASSKKVMERATTVGGGDGPESVYDGIARTIEEMNWSEGRRRVILLIGDAPALDKPKSDYDLTEIIEMTKAEKVAMNFYPVVIGIKGTLNKVAKPAEIKTEPKELISQISPNPATNMALLKTNTVSDYTVEVFDINGKLIESKNFNDNNVPIYTDTYPTGVYIIRLIDQTNKSVDTQKLVVKRG